MRITGQSRQHGTERTAFDLDDFGDPMADLIGEAKGGSMSATDIVQALTFMSPSSYPDFADLIASANSSTSSSEDQAIVEGLALRTVRKTRRRRQALGPTDQEKIDNAEKMFGTGSPQHEKAKKRFAPKPTKGKGGGSGQNRDDVGRFAATVPSTDDMIMKMIDMLGALGVDYHHYDLRAAAEAVAGRAKYLYTGPASEAEADEKAELDDSDYYEELDIAARSDRAPWLYERGLY